MDYTFDEIDTKGFKKRVTAGICRAMKDGYITKIGDRYRMGYDTETVKIERFDMEEIMPGEPLAMLPDGNGESDLQTMEEIRQLWLLTLLKKDAAVELGVPEDCIMLRYNPDDGLVASVVEEQEG